jgi:hypothetical protein
MESVISNVVGRGKKIKTAPEGSTSLASLIASDVAISWLAGEIAKMMQFG